MRPGRTQGAGENNNDVFANQEPGSEFRKQAPA
jgi:hypothetical protein